MHLSTKGDNSLFSCILDSATEALCSQLGSHSLPYIYIQDFLRRISSLGDDLRGVQADCVWTIFTFLAFEWLVCFSASGNVLSQRAAWNINVGVTFRPLASPIKLLFFFFFTCVSPFWRLIFSTADWLLLTNRVISCMCYLTGFLLFQLLRSDQKFEFSVIVTLLILDVCAVCVYPYLLEVSLFLTLFLSQLLRFNSLSLKSL
ncbi:unnamed protein product [Acanthosepion pharaonis]|uniref:Uncharacterized protein n=1 Tax=Acanthosepion pharaonis TaxID=158019 RepID=A0A812D7Y9_ACAPH|nr:unnamed protein product [Sepia pharaonis]